MDSAAELSRGTKDADVTMTTRLLLDPQPAMRTGARLPFLWLMLLLQRHCNGIPPSAHAEGTADDAE